MQQALDNINAMIVEGDVQTVMAALTADHSGVDNVTDTSGEKYHTRLEQRREEKGEVIIEWVWLRKGEVICVSFIAFDERRNNRNC